MLGDLLIVTAMAVATADRKMSLPPKKEARKSLPVNVEYEDKAKALLRERLAKTENDYASLAEKLHAMGIEITGRGQENKISRGSFSAAFLLQCMDAIDAPAFRAH